MKKVHLSIVAFDGEDPEAVRDKAMEAVSKLREIRLVTGQVGNFGKAVTRDFKVERHFAKGEEARVNAELERMGVV